MKRYIPSQKQWQTVIDTLYSVLPLTFEIEGSLNMLEGEICGYYHTCGTIHCLGGWYGIGKERENIFKRKREDYVLGANYLAKDLGFDGHNSLFSPHHELQNWTSENSDLWLNNNGNVIFSSAFAFDHGNGRAENLEDIIQHFELVKEQCRLTKK